MNQKESPAVDVKQVIVMRRFPNLRIGKYISQACHATMGIFFKNLKSNSDGGYCLGSLPYFKEYIEGRFKKIVVYVDTEEELLSIFEKAQKEGIHASLIKDAGLTEFKNVATYTAVGLGPWKSEDINKITGHLKLL